MVTTDPWLVASFAEISREVGIEAQASDDKPGVPEQLSASKYEAVLLDFDTVSEAAPILTAVRQSRSNEKAVVFVIATDASRGQAALEHGANVVLERPLERKQIRRAVYAAYDLIIRERRRYFRCAVDLPVLLIHSSSGADFRCRSMNISSSGMALGTPSVLNPGEVVQIVWSFEANGSIIRAIGIVMWDDKHGKAGISFKCTTPQHQADLDAWLDRQLLSRLGPSQSEPGAAALH